MGVSSLLLEGFKQEQEGLCPGGLGKEPGLRVRDLSPARLSLSCLNSPRKQPVFFLLVPPSVSLIPLVNPVK